MAVRNLIRILSAAASAVTLVAYVRYRKEIREIRDCVDRGSTIAETVAGPIEYAEAGAGEPLLLIHGAGGGYDQGLLIARDFGEGHRVIAPSRFGYLKTPVPEDASPAAQADAHAALLDFLGIGKCIVAGASAGAPSAIEFALGYPDRVRALILLVPRTYDPTNSVGVDDSMRSQMVLRLVEASADFLFWLAMRVARSSIVRFLGVPPELEAAASDEDRRQVTEMVPHEGVYYAHDDFEVRTQNMHENERANGHAHVKAMLLSATSHAIPVVAGEPGLGAWQRLIFFEMDEPKDRTITFHVFGG